MDIQKRLLAAKAASKKASDAVISARKKLDIELRDYESKKSKPLIAARKAAREAIAKITDIELEAAGLTPGKTIVSDGTGLWMVRIRHTGYAELEPMTKAGKPHMGKYPKPTPYNLSNLRITDIKVSKADTAIRDMIGGSDGSAI